MSVSAAMPHEERSDTELMHLVRAGDAAAFDRLYALYQQQVFAYCWRLTDDVEVAADLRQEAFLRLWQSRDQWDAGRSVYHFLLLVARGLIVDSWRRAEVQSRLRSQIQQHLRVEVPTPDTVLDRRLLASRIQEAVAELPPRAREVFSLKRDAGLSHKEIAEILEIAPKTVEVHMGRALAALRAALGDLLASSKRRGGEGS